MSSSSTTAPRRTMPETNDEEDDYMSMTITEPSKPKEKEIYTQRRIRKEREAELKSRPPSKAELASLASTALSTALSTSLPPTSKGFQMMAKLGFQPGHTLGAVGNPHARAEPLGLVVKEDRGGIGLDGEKKRKVREEMEREGKRVKAEEGEYRGRVAREREERRVEGLVWGAMRVLEGLEEGEEKEGKKEEEGEREKEEEKGPRASGGDEAQDPTTTHTSSPSPSPSQKPPKTKPSSKSKSKSSSKPPSHIPLLYRALPRSRFLASRNHRMRHDLQQSLSYPTPDPSDHQPLPFKPTSEVEELEEEDPELDAFLALDPAVRLQRLVRELREKRYCFWCKWGYEDGGMEGCPGEGEEEHG